MHIQLDCVIYSLNNGISLGLFIAVFGWVIGEIKEETKKHRLKLIIV